MIQIQCATCNASYKTSDTFVGRECSCPKCGQWLAVPASLPASNAKQFCFPRLARPAVVVAVLALVLLIVPGLSWFDASPDTPSGVLVGTIMNANAGNYSAAEESFLPDAPFLHDRS
jgi:hypothetical protein